MLVSVSSYSQRDTWVLRRSRFPCLYLCCDLSKSLVISHPLRYSHCEMGGKIVKWVHFALSIFTSQKHPRAPCSRGSQAGVSDSLPLPGLQPCPYTHSEPCQGSVNAPVSSPRPQNLRCPMGKQKHLSLVQLGTRPFEVERISHYCLHKCFLNTYSAIPALYPR